MHALDILGNLRGELSVTIFYYSENAKDDVLYVIINARQR